MIIRSTVFKRKIRFLGIDDLFSFSFSLSLSTRVGVDMIHLSDRNLFCSFTLVQDLGWIVFGMTTCVQVAIKRGSP